MMTNKDVSNGDINNIFVENEEDNMIKKLNISSDEENVIEINETNTMRMHHRRIIMNNEYVKKFISNSDRNIHSLSYLIDAKLTQSDCVKIGTGLEYIFKDIILEENNTISDIKEKNKKGEKEKDHLFKDEEKKIIFYAELKSNLFLDTEKSKATYEKCIKIKDELTEKYSGYEIKMFLVGLRYCTKEIIPNTIKNKYISIKDNLVGINEYLNALSLHTHFNNENEYKIFLNDYVNITYKY